MKVTIKPGLHIVIAIKEHVCDGVSKRILRLSIDRLKISLVQGKYL